MSDLNAVFQKLGAVDANVKTLLERTEGFDKRLRSVEHKVWWASGAVGLAAFLLAHIVRLKVPLVGFLLTAMLLFATPAGATSPGCVPIEAVEKLSEIPDYRQHWILAGEAVTTAVMVYNSAPPESAFAFTVAILVSFKDGSGVLLVGVETEICGHLPISQEEWEGARRALLGWSA